MRTINLAVFSAYNMYTINNVVYTLRGCLSFRKQSIDYANIDLHDTRTQTIPHRSDREKSFSDAKREHIKDEFKRK